MRVQLGLLVVFLCAGVVAVRARADVTFEDSPGAVRVRYSSGTTELDELKAGAKLLIDRATPLESYPSELEGLTFTRRPANHAAEVTIDAPAGATVYLIIGNGTGGARACKEAEQLGWSKVGEAHLKGNWGLVVYKQALLDAKRVAITGGGLTGVVVAAKSLVVESEEANSPKPTESTDTVKDPVRETAPVPGATTRPSKLQASVQALEIIKTESGMMLGQTSEAVLTVSPGTKSKVVTVRFITPVGDQMLTVRDEMLRYIHLAYPNWYAEKAEITFEDKYVKHDGGSIGAALGTLILSVIQGFDIDPASAITGDISANGKVRAIGGVSAKMRGAAASKCRIVAVPSDNFDQLVDALVYSGLSVVTDVQIIGVATLNDAVSVMRADRDARLTKAIDSFSEIQQKLHDDAATPLKRSSDYVHSKEIQQKLRQVLELAPNHLSAKLLLEFAQNTQPKTLSPTASEYYTFVAVRGMVAVLSEHAKSSDRSQVTPAAVRQGLADLNKLRGLSDPTVRPLIDAWIRFISEWSSVESGGSGRTFERQRQAVLDEMAKLQADQDLMQKMLKEGI